MAAVRAREIAFAKTMADRDHAAFATFVAEEALFMGRAVPRAPGRRGGLEALFEGPAPFSWPPDRVEVATRARSRSAPAPSSTPRASAPAPSTRPGASRRTASGGSCSTAAALPAAAHEGASMTDHVRVCRDCGEEYRPEIVRCADCGGELEDRYEAGEERSRHAAPDRTADGRARRLSRPLRDPAGRRPRAAGRAAARGARRVPPRRAAGRREGAPPRYALLVHESGRRRRARGPRRPRGPARGRGGDVHAVETRFDPERGYVQCPACGARRRPGRRSAPSAASASPAARRRRDEPPE